MKEKDNSPRGIKNETRRFKRKKLSHCIDWRNDEKTMCGLELVAMIGNYYHVTYFDGMSISICNRCRALLDKRREDERKEFLTIQRTRKDQKGTRI